MSPIGGQCMNTGFADAEMLAHLLARVLRDGKAAGPLLAAYSRDRSAAFRVAAARAARGMWLGTRTGIVGSALRRALITRVLLRPSVKDALPAYFAMLDLPFSTADTGRSGS
jgi:2-polyprenyl-6-methoxyphenol hydroxylase-like FAD-dependent oxidoreductase